MRKKTIGYIVEWDAISCRLGKDGTLYPTLGKDVADLFATLPQLRRAMAKTKKDRPHIYESWYTIIRITGPVE